MSVVQQFESVIPKLQSAIEEIRRISMDLRPSLLDDIGVVATLSWFCREAKQASPKWSLALINPILKKSTLSTV